MALPKNHKLTYTFTDASEYYGRKFKKCLFCETKFPPSPIVIGLTDISWTICNVCILSDTKTLLETLRATTKRQQRKADRLARRGVDPEDYFDYEVWPDSYDDITFHLERLGDVSKIINHDLAVLIARHFTDKRTGKAA
jgi:hypothetical protein